jgi:hypothetical protein
MINLTDFLWYWIQSIGWAFFFYCIFVKIAGERAPIVISKDDEPLPPIWLVLFIFIPVFNNLFAGWVLAQILRFIKRDY